MTPGRQTEPRARRVTLPDRGGEMALLDFGPPERPVDVVFSHATGFNARTYRSLLQPLAGELRILAPDLRGHGASTLPAERAGWPGWNGFRDDLLALLQAETEGPVVLAGHSMGATASLLAAAARPDRARALVLAEPVLFPGDGHPVSDLDFAPARAALRRRRSYPSAEAATTAYRGRGAFATWTDEQLADYLAAGLRQTAAGEATLACPPEWEALIFGHQNIDAEAAIAALEAPAVVLFGERDATGQYAPPALAAHPRVRLETLPGTSHFLPMEQPQAVRRAILAAAGA
jgi:pimeloyl-ACP methyl ester carboxylesterase